MGASLGICTRGTLRDARTGRAVATYEFTMLTVRPSGPGELAFTGTSTITKLEGAPGTLHGQDTGTFRPEPDGTSPFETRVTVVGGGSSYEGASGSIAATGELHSDGSTTGTYTGRVAH